MKLSNSPELDAPLRDRLRAALDIAVAALRLIERTSPRVDLADEADAALAKIRTLVPEIGQ